MSTRKKILHLIESGGLYGAETVILQLSNEMKRSGTYEPVICCIVSRLDEETDLYDAAIAKGFQAEKVRIRNLVFPLDVPRAARRLRSMGIDQIHCHNYKASVFGFMIKLLLRIPILSTCHLWFIERDQPVKQKVMIAAELFFYKFFKRVVCVSQPIKDILKDEGIKDEKIRIIPNGIDVELSPPEDEQATNKLRESLPLDPKRFCIVNTGRLVNQKAQKDIIKAASILKDSGDECAFYIAGDGPLHEELTQQIASENVGDSVCLLGFRSDAKALLEMGDVFVLPSLEEGMPMSLIEATSIAMPVIVTDVGDIHKLIKDNESGLIVPQSNPEALASAIRTIRDNPGRAAEMALKAQTAMKNTYTSDAMFKEYDEVYMALS